MRTRANLVDLGQRYEQIKKEVLARRSKTEQVQRRLEVMAYLHCLADEMALVLDFLGELDGIDRSKPTPAWLTADRPIAALRAYRVELLGLFETALGKSEAAGELAQLRDKIAREPAPGLELIDSCKILIWYTQILLFLQTQVEAVSVTVLPIEGAKDEVDEAVRASMPEAAPDQTLARLKQFSRNSDNSKARTLGSERKDIARRRNKIDQIINSNSELFRQVANDTIGGILRRLPDDGDDAKALREYLEHLTDGKDPMARRATKSWLAVVSWVLR